MPLPAANLRWLLTALCASGLLAQEDGPRRTCRIQRIGERFAPRIDGHLDDPCWRDAPEIGELTMVEPWLGRAPEQRTVVKLLHDHKHLYLSIWCEQDPDTVRDSQRVRDARLDPDDRVEIMFDPFENRRTAYFFQIGPGGSLGDAIVSANGNRFEKPWDALWWGRARRTTDGWVAELAIPFRSIPRRRGATSWGFNMKRYVRHRNEEYQWANPSQAVPFFRVSGFGTVEGFGEIDRGLGVELVPYATTSLGRDRSDPFDPGWGSDFDAGGELYYRLSPSMTLATTVRTDFAQTENDGRQINLNRFPLFFPEKRDFFLDGTSYYTFGSQFAGGSRFLPYFTRRIGLDDGRPIPIEWGAKLQGEAGPLEVGLIDVQVDSTTATDRENLAVARVKYALDDESTVGLIATNGDPSSTADNTVVGVDFYHRVPDFVGDLDLQINVDALVSSGSGTTDDGESYGAELQAIGQEWTVRTGTRWVADDFRPALGFVTRTGIRQSELSVDYKPRLAPGSDVRRYLLGWTLRRAERENGDPQQVDLLLDEIGAEFQNGDRLTAFGSHSFDRVFSDFALFQRAGEAPRATVRAGDYWQTRGGLRYVATEGRDVNGTASVSTGDFFGGTSTSWSLDADWRQSALLQVGAGYSTTAVDLGDDGRFTTQIASARLDLYFDPFVSLRTLVQFDNESNRLGWQSRLRWIYAPGCDVFVVFGSTWQRDSDGALSPTEQRVDLKIVQTLRF
ncbi:MAG: carbohydrate binding family 9 domain-containing protein [Planctomycetota bacterium]